MRLTPSLLMVLAACALTAPASASLIVNGSFEAGPDVPDHPGYLLCPDADSSITGWIVKAPVAGRDIEIITTYWQPADGLRSLDLNGRNGPGGIAQTFATSPGHQYDVSFMMAGNPGGEPLTTLKVLAAGQAQEFTFDASESSRVSMGWVPQLWSFTAAESSTELWFHMVFPDSGSQGCALDMVDVLDRGLVPEPAAAILLSLGLALVAVGCWRRRRIG